MATEVKKPTDFTDTSLIWADEASAYDTGTAGDETTYANGAVAGDYSPSIEYHTWAAKGQTYTATVLKVKWQVTLLTGDDEWGITYTKNNSDWYDLLAMGTNRNASIVTAQIALDANQDLTLVKIRINTEQLKAADGINVRIYDIWTEGTYTEVTAVSDTVQSIWNVLTSVSSSVQLIFNVRAIVSTSIQFVYNIRAAVSGDIQFIWNVLSDILTAVWSTITLKWKVRDQIPSVTITAYRKVETGITAYRKTEVSIDATRGS